MSICLRTVHMTGLLNRPAPVYPIFPCFDSPFSFDSIRKCIKLAVSLYFQHVQKSASVKEFFCFSRKRIISFLRSLKADEIYQVFNINRYADQDTIPASLPAAEAAICTILLEVPERDTSRTSLLPLKTTVCGSPHLASTTGIYQYPPAIQSRGVFYYTSALCPASLKLKFLRAVQMG